MSRTPRPHPVASTPAANGRAVTRKMARTCSADKGTPYRALRARSRAHALATERCGEGGSGIRGVATDGGGGHVLPRAAEVDVLPARGEGRWRTGLIDRADGDDALLCGREVARAWRRRSPKRRRGHIAFGGRNGRSPRAAPHRRCVAPSRGCRRRGSRRAPPSRPPSSRHGRCRAKPRPPSSSSARTCVLRQGLGRGGCGPRRRPPAAGAGPPRR